VAIALLLAGCSQSTSGRGAPDPTAVLSCAPGAVTATAAPFCYPVPAGFRDETAQIQPEPGWTYRSRVALSTETWIGVVASSVGDDTDADDDTALAKRAEQMHMKKGQFETTTATEYTRLKVAGARAFEQYVTYKTGVAARSIVVYRGRTIVQITCFLVPNTEAAERSRAACSQVLDTIQIVSLPR